MEKIKNTYDKSVSIYTIAIAMLLGSTAILAKDLIDPDSLESTELLISKPVCIKESPNICEGGFFKKGDIFYEITKILNIQGDLKIHAIGNSLEDVKNYFKEYGTITGESFEVLNTKRLILEAIQRSIDEGDLSI